MDQNQMLAFVTLEDIDGQSIELNPAFIIYMQRITVATSNRKNAAQIPATKLQLTVGEPIYVIQTPEEIANLQMETVGKVMATVMHTTAAIMNGMEEGDFL